jgi:hypothetical protein
MAEKDLKWRVISVGHVLNGANRVTPERNNQRTGST